MLENDKGDEGGSARTPSLSASSAGAELSSLHTFAGKSSDNSVGQQQPVIHFIDGVNQGWTSLNNCLQLHCIWWGSGPALTKDVIYKPPHTVLRGQDCSKHLLGTLLRHRNEMYGSLAKLTISFRLHREMGEGSEHSEVQRVCSWEIVPCCLQEARLSRVWKTSAPLLPATPLYLTYLLSLCLIQELSRDP